MALNNQQLLICHKCQHTLSLPCSLSLSLSLSHTLTHTQTYSNTHTHTLLYMSGLKSPYNDDISAADFLLPTGSKYCNTNGRRNE